MYFKCLVSARMTADQVSSGLSLRYRPAILPDGALGTEGSCNCELFVVERALPYYEALSQAGAVHLSHVPYQHRMLVEQGYAPLWVPCL